MLHHLSENQSNASRPPGWVATSAWWAGFSAASLWALLLLVTTAAAVGYRWSDLLDANGEMDWLLGGIWLSLSILFCWGVRPWADAGLVATGLVGGAVIETWGTHTGLWEYFTGERPPVWILPAWPIASVAIERLGRWLRLLASGLPFQQRVAERACTAGYWLVLAVFCAAMFGFMHPAYDRPFTWVVVVLMLFVVAGVRDPRADLTLFAAGTALGLLLEYWGTSRQCWTYYSGEVPPLVAVAAHGFAALAFSRVSERLPGKFRSISSR